MRQPPRIGPSGAVVSRSAIPDRAALAEALRRLREARAPIEGASDHGVSEALYTSRIPTATLSSSTGPPAARVAKRCGRYDKMLTVAAESGCAPGGDCRRFRRRHHQPDRPARHDRANRARLRELRGKLLQLHKVLLDDARAAYEMDRGRVPSNASLLQLVINDPWFAWLHSLSELVVRIDETIETDSPATDADAAALINQVEKLLTASENGEGFHRRYLRRTATPARGGHGAR